MPKFHVSYTLVKTFPEGSDVRQVELDVDDMIKWDSIIAHPDLTFLQVTKIEEPVKKPRKKKEKKDV